MTKRKRVKLNVDMANPLTQNLVIYTCTYILSICFSLLLFLDAHDVFSLVSFLPVLVDCIVPTTATSVLGSLILNIVLASQAGTTRYANSFWTLIIVVAYILVYPSLRDRLPLWLFVAVLLFSAVIVVLGMHSILQVHDEIKRLKIRSISG